jgi:hypothetical protein
LKGQDGSGSLPLNLVGPTCWSARTRSSASLPQFRGSMREALLGRNLSPIGEEGWGEGASDTAIGFAPRAKLPPHPGLLPQGAEGVGYAPVVACLFERLTRLRIVLRIQPIKMGPTSVAVFEDICRNLVQIFQN